MELKKPTPPPSTTNREGGFSEPAATITLIILAVVMGFIAGLMFACSHP